LAVSTTSFRRMTSMLLLHERVSFGRSKKAITITLAHLRGMAPRGTSDEFSWIRTFCQSANLECSGIKKKSIVLPQVGFKQVVGCIPRCL
jgi:hypothetical protein